MDALKKFATGASFQPLTGRELVAQTIQSGAGASFIPLSYLQTSYPAYIEELNKQRTCMHCNATFVEYENIGLFKCRMHPGPWIEASARWACCNRQTRSALTCVQCDHVDAPVRHVAVVLVPVFVHDLLPHKPRQSTPPIVDRQATRVLFAEDAQHAAALLLSDDEIGYFRAHSVPVRRKICEE
jgi:hypothetical protein